MEDLLRRNRHEIARPPQGATGKWSTKDVKEKEEKQTQSQHEGAHDKRRNIKTFRKRSRIGKTKNHHKGALLL